MSSVYLAGPITGLTFDNANDWREYAADALAEHGIDTRNPLRAKQFLKEQGLLGSYGDGTFVNPLATDKGITTRDRNDVTSVDLIIANFLGATDPSLGTAVEFGWADAARVPIIMVMEASGNPHEHGMLRSIAGFRVETLDEALTLAIAILR